MFLNAYNLVCISYNKLNRISTLTFLNRTEIVADRKPRELLNSLCKYHGSTYAGRVESMKHLLNIKQKVPVLVCLYMNCIFFPTHCPNSEDCIWIQARMVKRLDYIDSTRTLVQFDNSSIEVNIGIRSIKKQLERCKLYYEKVSCPIDANAFMRIMGGD